MFGLMTILIGWKRDPQETLITIFLSFFVLQSANVVHELKYAAYM
jgi:hypothetical protein